MPDNQSISMIIAMVFLIAGSGLFSATETAFNTFNRVRMKNLAADGNKRAALVLKLSDDYDSLISTILIGNNIVNIALTAIATVLFIAWFPVNGAAVSTAVTTVLVLVFGEVSPKSIVSFGPNVFSGCKNLKSINLPKNMIEIPQSFLANCSSLENIELPENITSIGSGAFVGTALKSIQIPETVTSIGRQTFTGCDNLTSIVIPNGVTVLEKYTFMGCQNLQSVTLPEGLVTIENGVFEGCRELSAPNIPATVTTIGE